MASGKNIRLSRLRDSISDTYILTALDHGFTLGPIRGIQDIGMTTNLVASAGATGVIVHKGIIRHLEKELQKTSVLVHLSGSVHFSQKPNYKIVMGSVQEALTLGADGISLHVNLGSNYEDLMLSDLSAITTECHKFGLPLLVMMYVRGENLDSQDPALIAHAARVAYEVGADIVKVDYTGNMSTFEDVIQGCKIPVIIAGGDQRKPLEFLRDVRNAILAGASGVSVGRNIFQANDIYSSMSNLVRTIRDAKKERDGVIFTTMT